MVKIINQDTQALGQSLLHGPTQGLAQGLAQGSDGSTLDAGVTLDSLQPGQGGLILRITAEPALKLHLMELGFVTGSPITFLMTTPFGDPNIYALRGTSIALRKSEAQCIRVRI